MRLSENMSLSLQRSYNLILHFMQFVMQCFLFSSVAVCVRFFPACCLFSPIFSLSHIIVCTGKWNACSERMMCALKSNDRANQKEKYIPQSKKA